MEARLVPQHGVDFEAIALRGVRGKGMQAAAARAVRAVARRSGRACGVIRRRAPDVVLGFGGFASFPGALMGVACGKPLAIHDANAVAGLANRILAYGADRILLGFPNALRRQARVEAQWVGNPLRDEIVAVPPPERTLRGTQRTAAPARRRRQPRRGGVERARAGGARAACPPKSARSVVHQAGEKHIDALRAAYADAGVAAECVPFIDDMARATRRPIS